MRAKRADTKWNGVFFDPNRPKPYRAWIKTDGKLIILGMFSDEIHAALAADLARWLCWGEPEEAGWYCEGRRRMSNPPNKGPVRNLPFDRQKIVEKLVRNRCVDPIKLANHLTAYDELAAKVEARTKIPDC